MTTPPPSAAQSNYLATLRKQWALSQLELGLLLGVNQEAICRYESGERIPERDVLLAIELVFGQPTWMMFPALYNQIITGVAIAAAELDARVRDLDDAASRKKQELLTGIAGRSDRASDDDVAD